MGLYNCCGATLTNRDGGQDFKKGWGVKRNFDERTLESMDKLIALGKAMEEADLFVK